MARIRTVKPEFWGHPVMGRSSDKAKIVGIAILNFSDDEGFFRADPEIVKANCLPYDDSVNIHTVLSELSRATWIELRKHEIQGVIGRVVNFKEHQRINRPTPSKLIKYWDDASLIEPSVSNHTPVTEDSPPERNREQGTGKRNKKRAKSRIDYDDQKTLDAYLCVFNAAFDRRCGAASAVRDKMSDRLNDGTYKPWQIIIAPLLQAARNPNTGRDKDWGPDILLRDGKNPRRSRDGTTYGATNWLERIFSVADTLRLDARLTAIAAHYGLIEDIKRTGCEVTE